MLVVELCARTLQVAAACCLLLAVWRLYAATVLAMAASRPDGDDVEQGARVGDVYGRLAGALSAMVTFLLATVVVGVTERDWGLVVTAAVGALVTFALAAFAAHLPAPRR